MHNAKTFNNIASHPIHPSLSPPLLSHQHSQRKIRNSEYKTLKEFADDVELMVHNAKTFNVAAHPVHTFADETRQLFLRMLQAHKNEYALVED